MSGRDCARNGRCGDCAGIKSFGVLEVPNRINPVLLWNFFLSRLKKMGGHLVNP